MPKEYDTAKTNATTATTTALTYPAFPLPLSTPFTTPFAVLPFTPFALHFLTNRAFSAGVIRCSTGCTAAISVPRFRYAAYSPAATATPAALRPRARQKRVGLAGGLAALTGGLEAVAAAVLLRLAGFLVGAREGREDAALAVVGFAGFFGVEGARVGLGAPVGAAWAFAVLVGGRRVWRTVAVGIVYTQCQYPAIVSKKNTTRSPTPK